MFFGACIGFIVFGVSNLVIWTCVAFFQSVDTETAVRRFAVNVFGSEDTYFFFIWMASVVFFGCIAGLYYFKRGLNKPAEKTKNEITRHPLD